MEEREDKERKNRKIIIIDLDYNWYQWIFTYQKYVDDILSFQTSQQIQNVNIDYFHHNYFPYFIIPTQLSPH